jgi:hypothetical protein
MVHIRNAHKIVMESLEGKRPLGRPRCRWEDNIDMDVNETGCEDVDRIHVAQDRIQWRDLVNMVMNI